VLCAVCVRVCESKRVHFFSWSCPTHGARLTDSHDVFNGKSAATLNLRLYNLFSLDVPAVGRLYWAVKAVRRSPHTG
jgi:hypothetical protein